MFRRLYFSTFVSLVAFLLFSVSFSFVTAASSTNFQIPVDALGGGGGRSTSGSFITDDVVGDVPGGQPSSATFQLLEGFSGATKEERRSSTFSALTSGGTIPTPPAPSSIRATATNTDITLTWVDPTTSLDFSYEILRDHTPVFGIVSGDPFAKVNKGEQKFVDTNVEFGKTYTYQIRLIDAANRSSLSSPVQATVSFAQANLPNVFNVRAVPAERSITLQWENPSDARIVSLRIQRDAKTHPGTPVKGKTVFTGTGTNFTDTEVAPGVQYFYTLFTMDSTGGHSSGALIAATTEEKKPPKEEKEKEEDKKEVVPEKPLEPEPVIPIPATLPEPKSVVVSAATGGQVSVTHETGATAAIILPPEAVRAASEVMLASQALATAVPTAAAAVSRSAAVVAGIVYEITIRAIGVLQEKIEKVEMLNRPATLLFTYTDEEVQDLIEETLRIWTWNEKKDTWTVLLDSTVNTTANTVTGTTTHFSLFTIMGDRKVVVEVIPKAPEPEAPKRIPAPAKPSVQKKKVSVPPAVSTPPALTPEPGESVPVSVPVEQPEVPAPLFSFEKLQLFVNGILRSFDPTQVIEIEQGSEIYVSYPFEGLQNVFKRGIIEFDTQEYLWQKNEERGILEGKITLKDEGTFSLAFVFNYLDGDQDRAALVIKVLPPPPPPPEVPTLPVVLPWWRNWKILGVIGGTILLLVVLGIFFYRMRKRSL